MKSLFLFLLLCVSVLPMPALRLEPLAEVALRPASGPSLDLEGLVTLSLSLSGASPEAIPAYRGVLDRWAAEANSQIDPGWDEARRAEALLLFLHTHLKSYSLYQTRLDTLIDRGTYNCVSSAVAYMILGRRIGLTVEAVATTDHAFALVRLADGREIDVETTTAYGFDPGTKTEFTDSFGRTGFVYVPPGNYSQRKTINDRQLLGLLIQNRMGDFQRAGQPENAVGPAIDRWVLEGKPEAFTTLVGGFMNYASWLNARKEYQKGLDLVDKMVAWVGLVPEVKDLVWALVNNQVNGLLDRQDFAGAQALTAAWKGRGFLSDPQSNQIHALITDRQLAAAVKTLPYAQAAERVEAAFAQGAISPANRQELLTFVYGQEVQKVASSRGAQAAWTFLGGLPAEAQGWPTLVKAKDIYAYNWSVEVHNRFAQLWNAGQKAEATQVVRDALVLLPTSALLKKDLVLAQSP